MDKLEYIPGDLAFHYIPKAIIKKYAKVYVCSTQNALSLEDMDGNLYDYIGELYPIPLTTEILEKNGWNGATHSKQSDDNTKILYKTFKRKGYPTIKVSQDLKITCELSPFIVKLESVSDLQHLLFGLGLDSNLKI